MTYHNYRKGKITSLGAYIKISSFPNYLEEYEIQELLVIISKSYYASWRYARTHKCRFELGEKVILGSPFMDQYMKLIKNLKVNEKI